MSDTFVEIVFTIQPCDTFPDGFQSTFKEYPLGFFLDDPDKFWRDARRSVELGKAPTSFEALKAVAWDNLLAQEEPNVSC